MIKHNDSRLKLIEKLGGRCSKCGTSKSLQIDHTLGQGYIEIRYFKTRKKMYDFYLNDYENESCFLQVLCANCNFEKRKENSEYGNRPLFEDFKPVDANYNLKSEEIEKLVKKYPQFGPLMLRWVRMVLLIITKQENEEQLNKYIQIN